MSTGLPMLASGRRNWLKARLCLRREFNDLQPGGHARVHGKDAWTSGIGHDRNARSGGKRLRFQAGRDIEHLIDRVGADDARLLEERIHGDVARGECGGVAASCPDASASCVRL